MIKAKTTKKKWITELQASSFSDNPSVSYIISGDMCRPARGALLDYSFELCVRFGEVWLSDDRHRCALILFSHTRRMTLSDIFLDLRFIFCDVGLASQKQSKEYLTYFFFFGVEPQFSHVGLGCRLLAELLPRSEKLGLPVYVVTSVAGNFSWYKRFGFNVYDKLDMGYRLHILRKLN